MRRLVPSLSVFAKLAAVLWYGVAVLGTAPASAQETQRKQTQQAVDGLVAAAKTWGADHVGKQLPMYVTGDECLFCHRQIGPSWPDNRHQLTMRRAVSSDPAMKWLNERLAETDKNERKVDFLLGDQRLTRFLRRSSQYGKLELQSLAYSSQPGKDAAPDRPRSHWHANKFSDRCAGCHTTAVDSKRRAFAAHSLDCFVCHGDVPLTHNKDTALALLSRKNRQPRQIASLCGQCHLRGGKSKSSGLPYPNQFVAGDNLFRDFRVDLTDKAIRRLPTSEQHIYFNVRQVANGRTTQSCLACHEVHSQATDRHQQLPETGVCQTCHVKRSDEMHLVSGYRKRDRGNRTCEY